MSQLRLRFGNYVHPDSEAAVSIGRSALLNDEGVAWAVREQWFISGRLESETQVEMTTKIKALESAYLKNVSVMALEFSNTGAKTAHVMRLDNSVGPIQVTSPPSYPAGFGAEYSGYRNYQITVEGITQVGPVAASIIDWQETIEVAGGYPRDVLVSTINTAPIRQRIANATPTVVRQTGSAASYSGWPIEPRFRLDIQSVSVLLGNNVAKTTMGVPVTGTSIKTTLYRTSWAYAFAVPILLRLPGTLRPAVIPVSKI